MHLICLKSLVRFDFSRYILLGNFKPDRFLRRGFASEAAMTGFGISECCLYAVVKTLLTS